MENLELRVASKEASLSVRTFAVVEEMSQPFDISIVARSPDEDLDLESLIGQGAAFKVSGGLAWTGICSFAQQIDVEPDGLSTYYVRIVPALWRLSNRWNNRIFQHLSVAEIATKLLAEWEIEPVLEFDAAAFPKLEYRVQYAETDLAFLSRMFEEAGVSYHFRPPEPGTDGTSRIVLVADPTAREGRVPIDYVNSIDHAKERDVVTHVKIAHRVRPGKLTVRDHDFRKRPDFQLIADAKAQVALEERYEHYQYDPGAFVVDPGRVDEREAKAVALRRLHGTRQGRRKVLFQTTAYDLSPGDVFSINAHPRADLAKDKRLLVVQRSFEGTSEGDWVSSGEAVFAADPFRPAIVTPKPRMSGLQSAVVVGPQGEEIHTDEHGRVRVQFHWDREGKYSDESSCWLRVSQGWAGGGFGSVALPRVGHEVLVDFLEGDPDQPVIVGRVFNGTAPHPYKLPDHKTKSVWKSSTSPGGGGFNEIHFEDAAGREKVYVHAQKDLEELVRERRVTQIGKSLAVEIAEGETRAVGADQTLEIGGSRVAKIEKSDVVVVGGEYHIQVGEVGALLSPDRVVLSTGQASITLAGGDIFFDASGSIKLTAGALAGIAGREVRIDGAPNVLLNTAGAKPPLPMELSAAEIALADLDLPEVATRAAKPLAASLFDEAPDAFQEEALEGALKTLLESPPKDAGDAPGFLMMPQSVNDQIFAQIDKVLETPVMIVDDILSRVELEQQKLAERLQQIKERAGEIAGDIQAKIKGAVEDLRARAEAAKQMAIAKFNEILGRLEAAKEQAKAKIAELRGRLEEAKARAEAIVEQFKAKLEAAKAAVVGKVNEIKERFEEAKARVHAKIDEMKGRIEAVKQQAKAKIDEIKARVTEIRDGIKERIQEMRDRVIALKEQAVERFEEMKKRAGEIIEMAKSQLEAAKSAVQELKARIEGAKEQVKQKVAELKGKVEGIKAGVKAKVEEVKAQAKAVVDDVKGQIESAKEQAKQVISDAKDLIADIKALPKELVGEAKTAWKDVKIEAKETWQQAKDDWKQTKVEAKDAWKQAKDDAKATWKQTKDEAKDTWEDAKDAWGDLKGETKDTWGEVKDDAKDLWGEITGKGGGAGEDGKAAVDGALGGGAGQNGASAIAGPQVNLGALGGGGASAAPDGSLGQIFSRSGGFTGNDVASAVNANNGATVFQSPGEGQLLVMKTANAAPLQGEELSAHLVEAQMNGYSSSDAFVETLTRKGYVVYERPWGELSEAFVKRAAVL
jgi:type VI secretion system secreted protein VgrG